jgi:hypothetical protein
MSDVSFGTWTKKLETRDVKGSKKGLHDTAIVYADPGHGFPAVTGAPNGPWSFGSFGYTRGEATE